MDKAESRARHRLALVGVALLLLALAVLIADNVALSRRVAALESAVAERDAADPLMAPECLWESRRHAGAGQSREHPCPVSLQRILQAPQQFEGRWVRVYGNYMRAFEVSALQAPNGEGGRDPSAEALWVDVPDLPADAGGSIEVVGRFHRGPAGHLGAYFGELSER